MQRMQKVQRGVELRQEMDQRVGRDVTKRLVDVPKLGEAEVKRLSELFNKHLLEFHPGARNFFVLFKHMDIDGSRRISFAEMERLLRVELKLRKDALPEIQLQRLWRVLDEK